jgi:hypothetical protein
MRKTSAMLAGGCGVVIGLCLLGLRSERQVYASGDSENENIEANSPFTNARKLISEGRKTFRFDTFGDEAFWGDVLKLHKAVEGAKFGGMGLGLSPREALGLGLKVDVDALLADVNSGFAVSHAVTPVEPARLALSRMNMNDSAIAVALLRANAVVGLTGFFNSSEGLRSIGIRCALCHSTVDNIVAPGIGHRLDGRANRDLNVGAIIAAAPNLAPVAELLRVDVPTVRKVP